MYFPATLKETQEQNKNKNLLPDITLNNNTNFIHFVQNFKYLGSIISNNLKEDTEIKARIGAESWSLSKQNLNALNFFHHSATR
jgi:tRNA G37 N-methylase Trm5